MMFVLAMEFFEGLGRRLRRAPPLTTKVSVAIAVGSHPFPFRTRKLSPPAPMVLGRRLPGRVGRRRISHEEGPTSVGLLLVLARDVGPAAVSNLGGGRVPCSPHGSLRYVVQSARPDEDRRPFEPGRSSGSGRRARARRVRAVGSGGAGSGGRPVAATGPAAVASAAPADGGSTSETRTRGSRRRSVRFGRALGSSGRESVGAVGERGSGRPRRHPRAQGPSSRRPGPRRRVRGASSPVEARAPRRPGATTAGRGRSGQRGSELRAWACGDGAGRRRRRFTGRPGSDRDVDRRFGGHGQRSGSAVMRPHRAVGSRGVDRRRRARGAGRRGGGPGPRAVASVGPSRTLAATVEDSVRAELARAVGTGRVDRFEQRLKDATRAFEAERYRDAARILKKLARRCADGGGGARAVRADPLPPRPVAGGGAGARGVPPARPIRSSSTRFSPTATGRSASTARSTTSGRSSGRRRRVPSS